MNVQIPNRVLAQGLRNALIVAVILAVAWGSLVAVLYVGTTIELTTALSRAGLLLIGGITVFGLWTLTRDLMARGRTLLDGRTHPWRWVFLSTAALFGIAAVIKQMPGGPGTFEFNLPVIELWAAALCLAISFGRLQLAENGLWMYWSLVRWDRIASYDQQGDSSLVLRFRGGSLGVPFARKGLVQVPAGLRDRFAAGLERHGVPKEERSEE